jgi:cell division protein FtsQ
MGSDSGELGKVAAARRGRAEARSEVLALPTRNRERQVPSRVGWLPSGRSVLVGLLIVLAAGGAYVVARETPAFALRSIAVRGAPPDVAAQIRRALAPLVGTSLVAFDRSEADRRLAALPEVAAASYDRDFPHTLRVFVRAERPVALLRQGSDAWLVSSRARVLRRLRARPYPPLPRVWIPGTVDVASGQTLDGDEARAVRTLAVVRSVRFPVPIRLARAGADELTLVLRTGIEVRLGSTAALRLKLEIARRMLPLASGAAYVDVSVPERSVAGYKSQPSS